MSARIDAMPGSPAANSDRPRSGWRAAIRTANPASRNRRTTRRPRKPVPPNTVAVCEGAQAAVIPYRYRAPARWPSASGSVILPVAVPIPAIVIPASEIEHVEQITDCRHIARHIDIVVVILLGVREIVAAAVGERRIQLPVPLDELHEGRMLVIGVADMAAL